MNQRNEKSFDTVYMLQILSNPLRQAIITSLASSQTPLKFSELMQAIGLDPNFDSGHFAYHISELMKRKIVKKQNDQYLLSQIGVKLSKVWDMVHQESSFLKNIHDNEREEKPMTKTVKFLSTVEMFQNEFWQKHWLPSLITGWSRAKATVESICKLLTDNGITSGKIFDLCCGTGRLSIWCAKKGFKVVGLDISPIYLEEASRRAREFDVESNVTFYKGDMRNIDEIMGSQAPFDGVLSFWNSIGFFGEKTDELIFTKARKMTKNGGLLIIGECDHLGQLMLAFDNRRVTTRIVDSETAILISDATMDYITSTFTSEMKHYSKEGDNLQYIDTCTYKVRVYSVSELASLLKRAGWKVLAAYEDIVTLEPFTHRAIYKGNRSMNIIAKAS